MSEPAVRRPLARWPLQPHATAPHWFYALVFFLGHGLMTRFDDARQILRWIRTMAHCAW
jgi:hypothetical protein